MPRRQSKCRLCQNHGILTPLRGHKYKCPFSSCSCFKCKTTQRQRATQRHSRVSGSNGYQLDGYRRKIDDVESDEDVRVTAWINGEEEQEETAGEKDLCKSLFVMEPVMTLHSRWSSQLFACVVKNHVIITKLSRDWSKRTEESLYLTVFPAFSR